MRRWIKVSTSLVNWEWYAYPEAKAIFLDCILNAKPMPCVERNVALQRGQYMTSIAELAVKNGLTIQQTRTQIKRLISTNDITVKTTNKYSIITVCAYARWQSCINAEQHAEQQKTTRKITRLNNVLESKNRNCENIKETHTNRQEEKGVVGGKVQLTQAMMEDSTLDSNIMFHFLDDFIKTSPCTRRVVELPSQLTLQGLIWLRNEYPHATFSDFRRILMQMGNRRNLEEKLSVVQTMSQYMRFDNEYWGRARKQQTGRLMTYDEMLKEVNSANPMTNYEAVRVAGSEKPKWRRKSQ